MRIAGVISGTSLDGIDVAICTITPNGDSVTVTCERFATIPFAEPLRTRIMAAYPPTPIGALELSALHAAIGEAFGDAIMTVASGHAGATPGASTWSAEVAASATATTSLEAAASATAAASLDAVASDTVLPLDAVASHGVTIAHDGSAHHTLQLGDPFRIRERTSCTVIHDFRSADTAAGGTGAPLVPFFDALLFAQYAPCVALNLGGIANMTVLPDGIAFDSGPANLPIDTYVSLRTSGATRYDANGEIARSGTVNEALLVRMLDDDYFRRVPPKTAGREEYGAPFISQWRSELDALTFSDAVATLTALTVRTVADAMQAASLQAVLVIASGGGARNPALIEGLRERLPGVRVAISDEFGVNADAKEAIAFAVLGYTTLRGRAAGLPRVTGASGPRVLGSIVPYELDSLLKRIHAEERPPTQR